VGAVVVLSAHGASSKNRHRHHDGEDGEARKCGNQTGIESVEGKDRLVHRLVVADSRNG
jgi:hypothetical protein